MSKVIVIGAGVVGQTYAGLLARAGHDVSIVARGRRADRLRTSGIVLNQDGRVSHSACRVIDALDGSESAEVMLVAVRGDQLRSVQTEVAASTASIVACMSNPLAHRETFEQQVGAQRTVFAFSGIGGLIANDGSIHYHCVGQQPTVVDADANAGPAVAQLMTSAGLPVRREKRMNSWLDTHTVFIGGIGAAILTTENGAPGIAHSRKHVRKIVLAVSEAFDALQQHGVPVRPAGLRTIFGRAPTWFATRYWQRQFAGRMVHVSIAPHVLSTRASEFPQIVDYALNLVGHEAPDYRRLVTPCASPNSRT